MNHLARGFVVPVWFAVYEEVWVKAWSDRSGRDVVRETNACIYSGVRQDWLHSRDPNRADAGDRPDLLEGKG